MARSQLWKNIYKNANTHTHTHTHPTPKCLNRERLKRKLIKIMPMT